MTDDLYTSPSSPPTRQVKLPEHETPATSKMAITSFVLGMIGLLTCLPAGVGLVLGIVSLGKIRSSKGALGGNGYAIAGIAVSAVAMLISALIFVFVVALMLPAFSKAREVAQSLKAENDASVVAQAMVEYHMNHASAFPSVYDWRSALEDDAESNAVEGDDPLVLPGGFSMNETLDGMYAYDVAEPSRTVLFFETPSGSSLAGGRELLAAEPSFAEGYLIIFVDATFERVHADSLDDLIWEPAGEKEPDE